MTARRRRKSGSGPSAAALIAWVEAAGNETDRIGGPLPAGGHPASTVPAADGRPLADRARGLAAGTLLACGSVLAVAVQAADSTSGHPESGHPGVVNVGPGGGSGGEVAPSLAVAEETATPPVPTTAQAFTGTAIPAQPVRRNAPLALQVPSATSVDSGRHAGVTPAGTGHDQAPQSGPLERALTPPTPGPVATMADQVIAPVDQVLAPVSQVVTPVASLVGHVAAPVQQVTAPVGKVLAPVGALTAPPLQAVTRPALTILSPAGRHS